MGANSCAANGKYPPINPTSLAIKISELIALNGGYVFLRHCIDVGFEEGPLGQSRRNRLIRAFRKAGFELFEEFRTPFSLTQSSPGEDLPNDLPNRYKNFAQNIWEPKSKTAMVFFRPGSAEYIV